MYAITQKSKPLSSLNGLQYFASLYRRTVICAFLHASRVIRRLLELPLKLICIFKNVLRYYEQLPNINSSRRNCCEIRYAGDVLITSSQESTCLLSGKTRIGLSGRRAKFAELAALSSWHRCSFKRNCKQKKSISSIISNVHAVEKKWILKYQRLGSHSC